jgi:apolipoprotein N-acyltransferase
VAAARLKAIETGRDTVQSSPTGYSAFVDHNGRVTARTGLGDPGLLVGTVEARSGQTIFVRFGDEWLVTAALLFLAAVCLGLGRRRR